MFITSFHVKENSEQERQENFKRSKSEHTKEMRRSTSFLNRIFKVKAKETGSQCPWLFEFQLGTNDRSYTFRCANREDRSHWVRIFEIIISMNDINLTCYE